MVDAAWPVEDGDTRVLLVQMGPLLDADDTTPVPDDAADVVDQGRADPVVRITVVPFCVIVVTVTLLAGDGPTKLELTGDPPDPVVSQEVKAVVFTIVPLVTVVEMTTELMKLLLDLTAVPDTGVEVGLI